MGLRDRLVEKGKVLAEQGLDRLGDFAAEHGIGPRLKELLEMRDDFPVSLQEFLVRVVDAVHGDGEHVAGTDVERLGKRNERIHLLVKALPGAGVAAGYVADLYCDTAIVCAVVEKHGLDLSAEAISAHLLVLWAAAPDLAGAAMVLEGDNRLLLDRARDGAHAKFDGTSKLSIVKMLWQFRRAGMPLGGSKDLKGFVWPRRLVQQRVDGVERQLAQWYPDPLGRFEYRFWDGAWTEYVSRAGAEFLDPPTGAPELRERKRLKATNIQPPDAARASVSAGSGGGA